MTKERREKIMELNAKVRTLADELLDVKSAEEVFYDELPEKPEDSEEAEKSGQAIETLDEVIDTLVWIQDKLDRIAF